jgi:hypothetical protein
MNAINVAAKPSRRVAYRVVPNRDDPAIFQVDGTLTRVLEISAQCVLTPETELKLGRRYPFNLDLPTSKIGITGYVDVLPELDNGDVVCLFVDLSPEELDQIHLYVLMRQKQVIREMKESA